MSTSALEDSDDDVMIIDDESDEEENSNDASCSSSTVDQKEQTDTQNEESCRNPWHEKWGNNDTKLKWPSQTPKMAQFIFTLLGYEPLGHKNRGRVKSKFCVTCIDRATGLTVEEFKELEAQAKSKWNQGSIKDLRSAQDKSLTNSRRQSENAHIQTQLEKLEKLDISDDEKARQAKQLRMLAFVNPGKFMDDFDPERSAREIKKMNRRCYKEKNVRKNQLYDENGVLLSNKMDWCDCLDVECPGCHFPCPKCNSEKCGGDCRCNRKWVYEYVESEGTGKTYSWNLEDVKKT